MAAPSSTVWGSIVGDYGRIGIYSGVSTTNTTGSVTVEIWFWSKYSVTDSANTLYYDAGSSSISEATTDRGSVSITTTSNSGGWSETNQVKLKTYTYDYNRETSAIKRYVAAKLTNIDRVGGTMTVTSSFSVPALTSYTISYNANSGSGAPSSQTKYYGINLTLSNTKPTRTGYTFKGWALSQTDANNGTWYYQAGSSCGRNESITLYAVWEENSLTVNYYSNHATYATFQGVKVNVSESTNVLIHSQQFYYDDVVSNGLADVQNTEYIYMHRTGYTPTGYWDTSTNGGTLISDKTSYSTGQALAQALGKSLANGNASVNIYPQWNINTYRIAYNANGGLGSINSQTVEWQGTFTVSNNTFKRDGYKFVGWNLYRNDDNKWYVVTHGWLTEDEILANGYSKRLYTNEELRLGESWIRENDGAREFTFYAIWEISGVVYIDNGVAFEPYLAYIDNGTNWELYLMYVDDGTNWNIIS